MCSIHQHTSAKNLYELHLYCSVRHHQKDGVVPCILLLPLPAYCLSANATVVVADILDNIVDKGGNDMLCNLEKES